MDLTNRVRGIAKVKSGGAARDSSQSERHSSKITQAYDLGEMVFA